MLTCLSDVYKRAFQVRLLRAEGTLLPTKHKNQASSSDSATFKLNKLKTDAKKLP